MAGCSHHSNGDPDNGRIFVAQCAIGVYRLSAVRLAQVELWNGAQGENNRRIAMVTIGAHSWNRQPGFDSKLA